jgi:SAM-dependent methyltransferase
MMSDDGELFWNAAAVVMPLGGGRVRLFQPVMRRNLIAPLAFMPAIDLLQDGTTPDALREALGEGADSIAVDDATSFTIWDHVFRNPGMFDADAVEETVTGLDEVLDLLADCGFTAGSPNPPLDYAKRSFADRFRGSYHEQIGTECLFNRMEPADWWTAQKFEPDFKTLRQTPYRFIEQRFLEEYIPANLPGLDVLEVGCGTGFFTGLIARHAASTVGMDYNADYIDAARRDHPEAEFHVGDLLALGDFDETIGGRRFDRVVLIDTFLFLFDQSFQNSLFEQRVAIMQGLARFLKPGGRILIMDPHPFWLTPWIGGGETPVGLISEYRKRWFKVTPTLEEVADCLNAAGLNISRILEPGIDDAYADIDPAGHAFMSQFPQWWFFEAVSGT